MTVKARLRVNAVLTIVTALIIGFLLYWAIHELNAERAKRQVFQRIVEGVSILRTTTFEYLIFHEERMRAQWISKENSVTGLLKTIKVDRREESLLLEEMKRNLEFIKNIYVQLVAAHDAQTTGSKPGPLYLGRETGEIMTGQLLLRSRIGIETKDEIGQLSQAFDQMTANLKKVSDQRQKAEEALQKAYEGLEVRVQERISELARSNAELAQVAHVASHDLQEPLRMISSYVQLLAKRSQGKLDTDADEFIAFAVDGANRMQRLIQDLLIYSRVGTREMEFGPVSCEGVLEQVLTNMRTVIKESRAEITHEGLPTIVADDSQLVQLFQNLISNAIKFRGEDVPRIHISAQEGKKFGVQSSASGPDGSTPQREFGDKRVGIRSASSDENQGIGSELRNPQSPIEEWVFSIGDNSIGIDSEYFKRIFVIFQRLHGKGDYPGTGIGLAICKKIVERHGGRMWVESAPGQGSVFYFTISNKESHSARII